METAGTIQGPLSTLLSYLSAFSARPEVCHGICSNGHPRLLRQQLPALGRPHAVSSKAAVYLPSQV